MSIMRPWEMHDTVVIGAGVIGASIGYHLAARGAAVTVVDAGLPASGATRHSFAWISSTGGADGPAFGLRDLSVQDWRRLGEEIPGLGLVWSGALTWGEEFGRAGAIEPPIDVEPRLADLPSSARFSPDEGWIDPVRASERLIEAARHRGAQIRLGAPVLRLIRGEVAGVIGVDLGNVVLGATNVIVAAGTGSAALCSSVGVSLPLPAAPAVMVRLWAEPGLIGHIVANDEFEARQSPDGTILMPRGYAGEDSTESLLATGETARRLLIDSFEGADDVRLLSAEVGWRPMTSDGEPAVGATRIPGLHVAVAHPGVCLAATIGRLVADELTTPVAAPELARFRPTRFDGRLRAPQASTV
ncbi:FAD-dependent oxidoreductase [Microbacterium sp. TPD7012]|uniref:NAD(P)/FAD-dependent oxidoreductase n=1 Tax=Microbacterium sp. TPD7012 TaxID=2171975 RepID=UPI000D522A5C|nr:FAD-dependent oxidoreductase [Microbacterium sp. TPD7012]PVE95605.1 FAD-dependent oxidoreductase [Microbacterium sp. TPD7012]